MSSVVLRAMLATTFSLARTSLECKLRLFILFSRDPSCRV